MEIDQIKEILETNHLPAKTLEVAGTIGKAVVYKLSVPLGKDAVRAWMDLQHAFDNHWAFITGRWIPPVEQGPSDVKRFLKKAGRLDGTKLLEQLKQQFAKDWRWFGDCDLAEDGIPERLHGKWPKKPEPRTGYSLAWEYFGGGKKQVQMILLPGEIDLDAPAWLGFGDREGYPPPETHLAMLQHWHGTYDLDLFGINSVEFELQVGKPPTTRKAAMQLAREQFFYCPDLVASEEGTGSVENLAAQLLKSHSWHFWWDGSIHNQLNTRLGAKESWQISFERDGSSFKEILTWDRFEDWELNTLPELTAEHDLGSALTILYSGRGKNYSRQFLEFAVERWVRSDRENKFKSKRCKSGFPKNRARAARVFQYSQALLTGDFSSDELIEASKVIEKEVRKESWGSRAQAGYLTTVRMALVGGDRPLAQKRLAIKKPFKSNQQERRIWKKLAATKGDLPLDDAALLEEFDAWFDKVRIATYRCESYGRADTERLEAAAIRYRYFVSKSGEIDWQQVIKQVIR